MTDQNNAAQPVLTDQEILDLFHYGQSPGRIIKNGRAIESAVLSKLRAEGVQAGDERAAFEEWRMKELDPTFVGYTRDELTLARAAWDERARRAALASAPVAKEPAADDAEGLTPKQAWWAGYRAGKGLPPDTPRQEAARAVFRCPKCGENACVSISSATLMTRWPDGTPRDERDIASDPEGKLIHDPSKPVRAASASVAGERECGNADCGWRGTTERMCGSVGPLCPECGEVTEAIAPQSTEWGPMPHGTEADIPELSRPGLCPNCGVMIELRAVGVQAGANVADIPRAVFALQHIAAWSGVRELKTHKDVRAYAKHNAEACAALASVPVAAELPRLRPPICHISGVSEGVLRRAAMRHRAMEELQDPSALAALADDLESIAGNENAELAAAYFRREADRMASAPVAGKCPPPPPPSLAYREIESGVVKPRPEPFMHHDDYPHNPRMFQPTPALASAPVAGEAIYQIKLPGDTESGWHDATEGAYWAATEKTRRIVYAAPQASEAVRDAKWCDPNRASVSSTAMDDQFKSDTDK